MGNAQHPFTNSAQNGALGNDGKTVIDPNAPISSLTAGDQQFTFVRDTNHGSALIPESILMDLDAIAQSGVKHIVFEYEIPTFEEMARSHPGLLQADDKMDFMIEQKRALEKSISGNLTDRLTPYHDADINTWNAAYAQAKAVYLLENPAIAEELHQIQTAINSIPARAILDQWNADPPQITEERLKENGHIFQQQNGDNSIEKLHMGMVFADILIQSKEKGIEIHFAGDNPDGHKVATAQALRLAFPTTNPAPKPIKSGIDGIFQAVGNLTKPSYMTQYLGIHEHVSRLEAEFAEARTAHDHEQARAERFIDLANGEKILVMWGDGHFRKSNDKNPSLKDAVDDQLKLRALEKGEGFLPSKDIAVFVSSEELGDALLSRSKINSHADIQYLLLDHDVMINPDQADRYALQDDNEEPNIENELDHA